jgi:hypothetical protein
MGVAVLAGAPGMVGLGVGVLVGIEVFVGVGVAVLVGTGVLVACGAVVLVGFGVFVGLGVFVGADADVVHKSALNLGSKYLETLAEWLLGRIEVTSIPQGCPR